MASIVLVTGGTRSGKSSYAQLRAEALPGPHCFLATCQATDTEMRKRVKRHKDLREPGIWETIEEPLNIGEQIREHPEFRIFLVDCLTLWISNLMDACQSEDQICDDARIMDTTQSLFDLLEQTDATVIFVTNEVGLGIVPANRVARRFRDLVGLCNQIIASRADEVVLVSCGLPLYLKK